MFNEKGGIGQQQLFNVLKTYAIYNPHIGYCQGMGMIVGMLLMYMPAEESFWVLAGLLSSSLKDVYDESLSQLRRDSAVFEYLLVKKSKKLARHLVARELYVYYLSECVLQESNDVTPIIYFTPWLMTLYTSVFPWETVLRVWDMFMCDGIKALFRVALAIMELSESRNLITSILIKTLFRDFSLVEQLLGFKNSGDILSFLLHVPTEVLQADQIIRTAVHIKLKKKQVLQLRIQVEKQELPDRGEISLTKKK
ncbi:hypothetical protein HK096_009617 [Nowakowskiella sp. JEL0078]|nr:hypothetical protein HK096_009617 [Nowakowskiella sp. JEL0078]